MSLMGIVLALCAFLAVLGLIAIDFTRGFQNQYMGILTYLVAPAFLVTGMLLIAVGAWLERRRRHKLAPGEEPKYLRLDFNVPRQRNAFLLIATITLVLLLMTAFGSYQAYHYTESVQFCGTVCHTIMKPEFTAHQFGAHARVTCTQCHIGGGATWFVKSKLSGSYQVYAALANKYPTPIPTPIENLRPAQDTCEQCHWPAKFYGQTVRANQHYMADDSNTVWNITLLMNIGGGDAQHGEVGGIHWHTSPNHTTEYIAADDKRQEIPWVRVTHDDGRVVVFESREKPLTLEQIAAATPRKMDCIDCHNRPAHSYEPPAHAVNKALAAGRLDAKLPGIKRAAVEALTGDYASTTAAIEAIRRQLPASATGEVAAIYQRTFFPEMKVNWRQYPSHIGHTIFPGCYRCHDGKHASKDGQVIRHDCNLCHAIIAQGTGAQARQITAGGLEFQHPIDIGDLWKEQNCADCHTGALAGQ
jgi:nitrate/TMAO reductase-like tetraheme cytochrome c subunit